MAIDFSLPSDVGDLRERVRQFIRAEVIPAEAEAFADGKGPADALRRGLQDKAAATGLLAPHLQPRWGGLGLDMRGQNVVFEEAGYSLLGPLALNCATPDEGNGHLLTKIATDEQQWRYLAPLARCEIRSLFAMTEPPQGAGSGPSLLATTGRQVSDGWVINGEKWFLTGADGAPFVFCMARQDGGPSATMVLVDADNPGLELVRHLDTVDHNAVLGEPGQGFRYAQVRLGPARLTHCMLWLAAARRFVVAKAAERQLFGQRLTEHGIDLTTAQTLIWRAAWALDTGHDARDLTSVAKVYVSEAAGRIIDRNVQLAGGIGIAEESMLGTLYTQARPSRIYDGPSEAHRWGLARRAIAKDGESAAGSDGDQR